MATINEALAEQARKVRETIGTEGWQEIIKPRIVEMRNSSILLLINGGGVEEDEALKGKIRALTFVLDLEQETERALQQLTAAASTPRAQTVPAQGHPYSPPAGE